MSQKHIVGVVFGVIGIGLLLAFVYQQFRVSMIQTTNPAPMMESSKTKVSERAEQAPVPETIDDVFLSIQEEASMDLSALDEEENGEVADIEADSDSVTQFETSYDENRL